MQSGAGGYTLYLADLPPMTQAQATLYTDSCAGGAAGAPGASAAARPVTGQAGVAAVIDALMRPVGAPAGLAWAALAAIPSITWQGAPMRMGNPYADVGADDNTRLQGGEFRTATTKMNAVATGDERTATRFQLREGGNLPTGAVFAALKGRGYAITPLRCGKVYTQTSQAWYRIAGPGKQPAILYRALHVDGTVKTEDYALRLDNLLPPAEAGQTPAPPAGCRSLY